MDPQAWLAQYVTPLELALYNAPEPDCVSRQGKVLVVDAPIKDIDRMLCKICVTIAHASLKNFSLIVANEAGAVLGALFTVGYTAKDIIELWASGEFDPRALIEDKMKTGKLAQKLHVKSNGATHKGLRFRDALDALLRKRLGGPAGYPVTFDEIAKRNTLFAVKAFDTFSTVNMPVLIHAGNYPTMAVADAVLASCAVQPYIRGVEFTLPHVDPLDKKEKDVIHTFFSCSNIETLPFLDMKKFYQIRKLEGDVMQKAVAYGYAGTVNLSVNTISTFWQSINAYRAPAVMTQEIAAVTKLF